MSIHRSRRFGRALGVTMLLCLISVLIPAPAHAVPANDTVAGARVVGGIPYLDRADTRGATPGNVGQDACAGNSGSVWYRFTPARNRTVTFDTTDSNHTAYLSAYIRSAGALQKYADECSTVLTATFRAGVTYYIQVSNFDGGGSLVFRGRGALAGTGQLDEQGTVSQASGDAFVQGSVTCNRTSSVFVTVTLRQRVNESLIATGSGSPSSPLSCSPGSRVRFSALVLANSAPFNPGDVGAITVVDLCDEVTCRTVANTRTVISLTSVRRQMS